MIENEDVRERANKLRVKEGLLQADMAELCKCTPDTLKNFFSGRNNPSFITFALIARSLRITMDELFYGKPIEDILKELECKK